MKRLISLILTCAMMLSLLSACGAKPAEEKVVAAVTPAAEAAAEKVEAERETAAPAADVAEQMQVDSATTQEEATSSEEQLPETETIPDFAGLSDPELLEYAEDEIYSDLVTNLDGEKYFVQEVSAVYVSKEYLEELEYNSKTNVFFGYSLEDLDAQFQGTRYAFTLGSEGETVVRPFEAYDDSYETMLKNVAIGTGVILVCVTVAAITKNPASLATAGKTIKTIYAISQKGATTGVVRAIQMAGAGGVTSAVIEAIQSGDWDAVKKAGLLGASEGYKFGAIFGTVEGIATGIKIVGNTRYFPDGTPQAAKYPEGVEFTPGANGESYPRFEKWKIKTATFDSPSLESELNHTGLSGDYYWDAKLANAQVGLKHTPVGYVWHHVEDMKTMILIPQDLHSLAMGGMRHTGGASLIRALLGL